jgi:S-adenosylmethionine uptake transporter
VKWLGIAIIIASGLYVIWRERQINRTATTPPVSTPI